MRNFYYFVFVALTLFTVSCSSATNTHDSVFLETLLSLEDIVRSLETADKASTPEDITSLLSNATDNLKKTNRKWFKLPQPEDQLWKELIESHGKRLVEVAESLQKAQFKYKSRDTRHLIYDFTSCWIFENSVVAQYAPILFSPETTLQQVKSIVRNSTRGSWINKEGVDVVRFAEAGLLVQFIDNCVISVNGAPVFSSRKQALELTKPGGLFSKDPGMKEAHQWLSKMEQKSKKLNLKESMVELTQGWIPIGSGSTAMVGNTERVIGKDLACLNINLNISNPNAYVAQLPVNFVFIYGKEAKNLDAYLDKNMKQNIEEDISVPAQGRIQVHFGLSCVKYEDVIAKNIRLKLRHVDSGLVWNLKKPAEYNTFFKLGETNQFLQAEIASQKWIGLPKGTEVSVKGEVTKLPYDYAGINVSLKITNTTDNALYLNNPLNIVNDINQKIDYFSFDRNQAKPKMEKHERLKIAPAENMTIYLTSRMKKYTKWKQAGNLYLRSPAQNWKIVIKDLPSRDVLYNQKE